MKKYLYILFLTTLPYLTVYSQNNYEHYFEDAALRLDFIFAGNQEDQKAYLQNTYKEPFWGGPKETLIDAFEYGEYQLQVFDHKNGAPLYTRGFCTLFEEWRTTAEAKTRSKAFSQSVQCPYPKDTIDIRLWCRLKDGTWALFYETSLSPDAPDIIQDSPITAEVTHVIHNGPAHSHVDIAFIAEGYTTEEQDKFVSDVNRMTDFLFSQAPFDQLQTRFNIWAIGAISEESGTDDPRKNIWKKTALNSSFNTFNTDRYLESFDVTPIRNLAANAPYDHIVVLVNTDKYGGGGIYNHFSICTADHPLSEVVFLHEFGHGFAGLGDEYYSSNVAYQDFFNLKIEPWQPNLTTLVNFESKWQALISPDTPIPTPENIIRPIGVYEGGGYLAKEMYRPALNCRMKSNDAPGFCPVCQAAITHMIQTLTN
jgi:hypothetical protein